MNNRYGFAPKNSAAAFLYTCPFFHIMSVSPQTAALNNGEWKTMEKKWKDALSEGKKVEVDIQIIYDSDSKRPKRFLVEYKITNEPTVQRIFNN